MKVIAQIPYSAKVDTLNAIDEMERHCLRDWGIPTQTFMDGHNWVRKVHRTRELPIQRGMTDEEFQVMTSLRTIRQHLRDKGLREI